MKSDGMSEEQDRFSEIFREEAFELLSGMEASLLELEQFPGNVEVVSGIFRVLHTIKGSGAMAGYDEVSSFAHALETVYDSVRNREIVVDKTVIDLTLSACDLMRTMIESPGSTAGREDTEKSNVMASFMNLIPESVTVKAGQPVRRSTVSGEELPVSDTQGKRITYRICFRPACDIFVNGTNPILLLNELRRLGDCKIAANMEKIPVLKDLNPEECYAYWDATLTTSRGINAIKDVFVFMENESELTVDVIDTGESVPDTEADGDNSVPADVWHMEENRFIPNARADSISNIRVSSQKLDKLVNLVGELVTVQARLSRTAVLRNDPVLLSISEEVERLTAELRDGTMSIRMLPIGTTFCKFNRLVRDLAGELGKEVELTLEGAETEIDKTVIEQLNDPLVHLIRNCIDHGIERPEEREKIGKARKGTVHLSAVHSGANILIQIKDDGAGIDPEVIRLKAIEKGLIAPDSELPEKDIFSMILQPGFSTTSNVTSVSGRGVGLDVVKKAMDSLRGNVDITSLYGSGTTITLILPLTLAIIDGLLVRIGKESFVLPLSAVEECIALTHEDRKASHDRSVAVVRGQIVPYISLREHFMLGGKLPEREQIVIITSEGRRIGFAVDEVIGEHQTVIKALGKVFKDIEGISGATILGDGVVALIIDVPKLIKTAEYEEVSRLATAGC